MSATTRNKDVSNTAARYVAKAMTRVHPSQAAELLDAMQAHVDAARQVMAGAQLEQSWMARQAADVFGFELGGVA